MTQFYARLLYTGAAIGLASALSAHSVAAQNLGDVVRSLNNVINPGDAQRLEDQARREHRVDEERYWRDYRTGLESSDRRSYGDRRGPSRFDPGDPRTFRSDAAINLELEQLSRDERRRYQDMTGPERRRYEDRLSADAQGRYQRMTDSERQRYIDDLEREQGRLDSARRR